ncbi:MAG: carboxypeptidase regulatory-like domain-containing protein [Acidobacteria bacterium]|nr:carboxypeptidase regulatory-like domain-containing protein [Acidobacteriota bacterium]
MKLVIALLLLGTAAAEGCTCLGRRPFCEVPPRLDPRTSKAVFVGMVVAADPITGFGRERRIRFRVEEQFLGSPGSEFTLLGGSGLCCDCSVAFQVGRRYLVVAHQNEGGWSTNGCYGTSELDGRRAEIELRALHEWKQGKAMTRSLDGAVADNTRRGLAGFRTNPPPVGWKVTLTGPGLLRETATREDGGFDFDQLPVARLRLTLSPPPGWLGDRTPPQEVDLTTAACASAYFEVREVQGSVRGRLRREDGRNPQYLPVTALPASAGRRFPEAHTNAAGEFTIDGLEPGDYLLAVHLNAQPDSGLVRSYYPGVAEPSQAHRFRVECGQTVDLPEWTLPHR